MNAKEIRDLGTAEIDQKVQELRQEVFNLRFRHATGQLENTQQMKHHRRTIARLQTIRQEKNRQALAEQKS